MKRLIKILCAIHLLSLTACQQVELPQDPVHLDGPEFTAQIETFGTAADTISETPTKTALANGNSVAWSTGDQIAIFQGASVADRYQVNED